MTVYFIGAGPGAPDLITVRGAELIARCPLIVFTGSLVPRELLARADPAARVLDSKGLTLEQFLEPMIKAHRAGQDVARVHTGDPLLFGAVAEQIRRLDAQGIPWEVVPGVSSFNAAAAALGKQLTLPEQVQTVILSRVEGRTPMPEKEQLQDLARHESTLCLFLSITLMEKLAEELIPSYGEDCPVAVVHKASMPEEQVVIGTLADIAAKVEQAGIRSQSMIFVGRFLTSTDFADSRLYAADFSHRFRKASDD